jgi:hypothetical protein
MKTVYKEGDLVKVINPEFVIRVGYPLTLEAALEHCEKTFEKEISSFCYSMQEKYSEGKTMLGFNAGYGIKDTRFFQETLKAVASHHLRRTRFGGPERTIHTELQEELRNTEPWTVESKRRVKTGIYEPGYTDYEGDYTQPFLSDEKTHTLLRLSPQFHTRFLFGSSRFDGAWEIESVNVEKIK